MTLEEIAALAGVSRATVSRVINDQPRVSAATRERVRRIIREQGYLPNAAARTLASRRSQSIGLVMPTALDQVFSSPYYLILFQGAAAACEQRGYNLVLSPLMAQTPGTYDGLLRSGRLDGLIITTASVGDAFIGRMLEEEHLFVLVGRSCGWPDAPSVAADCFHAGVLVGQHLARLGYERIATITGPKTHGGAVDRRDGLLSALRDFGLAFPPEYLVVSDFTEPSGYRGMQQLLSTRPIPQAVFCASDVVAVGALKAVHEAGLRVPDDVALVGFDDVPLATMVRPALTTVRQPIDRMGYAAASLLIDALQAAPRDSRSKLRPQRLVFPVELVVRDSCGGSRRCLIQQAATCRT